jgi:hypothetical protein
MNTTKKIFLFFLTGMGVFVIFLLCIPLFFGETVKKAVIHAVNQHLATPVSVEKIYFSVFENFPEASVSFTNISFEESTPIHGLPLASFEKISITLNLPDIFRKKISIRSIRLINGSVRGAVNKAGLENFRIFKAAAADSVSGSPPDLHFRLLSLENISLQYADSLENVFSEISAEKIHCSGNFNDERYAVKMTGKFAFSLGTQGKSWLKKKNMELSTSVEVDRHLGKILFNKTRIGLEKMLFQLDGYWDMGNALTGKINISTPEISIGDLLSVFPQEFRQALSSYKSNGKLSLSGSIEKSEKSPYPLIKASFSVNEGHFHIDEFENGIGEIHIQGSLLMSGRRQELVLERAGGRLGKDFFSLKGKLTGFSDPYLDGSLSGSLDLASLGAVIPLGAYSHSRGDVQVDLRLKGKWKDFGNPEKIREVLLSGSLEGRQLQLGDSTVEYQVKNMDVSVSMEKDITVIHYLKADWQGNAFDIEGEAGNLFAYLFNNKELFIRGKLKAASLKLSGPGDKKERAAPENGASPELPARIALSAAVEIASLETGSFLASDIRGNVKISGDVMEISGLKFSSCKGNISLKGRWQKKENGDNHIVASSSFQKVEIGELFRSFNNFGQQELTDKQLKGQFSGEVDLAFLSDRLFNLQPQSLYAYAKVRIENGELNHYKPLLALSRFIKVSDLENIRFQTLSNEIEIRDETIIIPGMEIKNNALDIRLEGRHSFSNQVDYSISMQLKDLLARSYASAHRPDEFEEEEKGISLFIRMTGPVENLTFRYDRKEARKNFRKDMKTERQTVRELLKKEFGIEKKNKKDSIPKENPASWEDDIPE